MGTPHRGERRRLLGEYNHNDTGDGTTIRLPAALDSTDFPNRPDWKSELELVEPNDGDPYLVVRPEGPKDGEE